MRSMTGYASLSRSDATHAAQISVRSTNFKYLDITIRNIPAEDIALEEAIKKEIKKRIRRGKIEVYVSCEDSQPKKIVINEKVVARYIKQAKALAKKYKVKADVGISEILALPQAISWQQKKKSNSSLVISLARQALDDLLAFKKKEGAAIEKEMLSNIKRLRENVKKITKLKPAINEMENGREDIDEEISLMSFYIQKLESSIAASVHKTKGKSIDFLTQEILRELNAASSKTKRKEAAILIVEAKNYLERVREQTQNIE
jgi:uncharacterized protein (TIGR00255 family)